jgi:hypothetical protein
MWHLQFLDIPQSSIFTKQVNTTPKELSEMVTVVAELGTAVSAGSLAAQQASSLRTKIKAARTACDEHERATKQLENRIGHCLELLDSYGSEYSDSSYIDARNTVAEATQVLDAESGKRGKRPEKFWAKLRYKRHDVIESTARINGAFATLERRDQAHERKLKAKERAQQRKAARVATEAIQPNHSDPDMAEPEQAQHDTSPPLPVDFRPGVQGDIGDQGNFYEEFSAYMNSPTGETGEGLPPSGRRTSALGAASTNKVRQPENGRISPSHSLDSGLYLNDSSSSGYTYGYSSDELVKDVQ